MAKIHNSNPINTESILSINRPRLTKKVPKVTTIKPRIKIPNIGAIRYWKLIKNNKVPNPAKTCANWAG
ncbi:hypothetical protein [Emticicia oligotrophica]|uniref:hypothetical protein n=1 Tax=Emticicia oligotrophica TaxID=312279 RepID=UPI00273B87F6|nr:hypothetical protein [Emticicia oligotrophica]